MGKMIWGKAEWLSAGKEAQRQVCMCRDPCVGCLTGLKLCSTSLVFTA